MGVMRPQVIDETNVVASLTAPTGARVAAMIGSAIWGPKNVVTTITTSDEFVNTFGDDKSGAGVTGIKGATAFFNNGGTMKFIRVVDGTEAKSDYMAQSGVTDVINFEALYEGTYGDNITVEVVANGSNRDVKVTDGKILEIFNNNGSGYATNDAVAAAINGNSSLVSATVEAGQGTINLLDAISPTQLTGGDDGETLTTTIAENAFDSLLISEDYNFLVVPGTPFNTDAFHNTMVGKLNARAATEKKYARFISGIAQDESIATAIARTAAGKRLTVVAPSMKQTHRIDGTELTLDGTYLACAYAGVLCQLDLEVSGTHENVYVEGLVVNSTSGKEFYNKTEQEQLLQGGIACISQIGTAVQMVRGITRHSNHNEIWIEESIVDIADDLLSTCRSYLDTTIGKPNTNVRRSIYAARLDSIMETKKKEGVIETYAPSTVSAAVSPDSYNAAVKPAVVFNTNIVYFTLNIS